VIISSIKSGEQKRFLTCATEHSVLRTRTQL
jgi:hypothetical protein